MVPLKVSYSGVRGVYGSSLTEAVAYRFGAAFVKLMQECGVSGPVLLARDTRPSGPSLEAAVLAAMRPHVPDIVDLGVMGTPTVQFAMRPWSAGGAVVVTASHNPSQWNGFKFFLGPENTVLDGEHTRRLFALYQTVEEPTVDLGGITLEPETSDGERAIALHVAEVLALLDTEAIRKAAFHVAVDTGGGAGARPLLRLLEDLGCKIELVDAVRDSEPTAENIVELAATVKHCGCAVGFAQDLDGDRLALVSDRGVPIGEDYTLALAVRHLLEKHRGSNPAVVKNLSTTRIVDDLVEHWGGTLIETPVGEINLSRALARLVREGRVAFGGEGNGGVILPSILLGRDSVVAAGFVLDFMARANMALSALVDELPVYHMLKTKVPTLGIEDIAPYLDRLVERFPEAEADRRDGLRLRFPNRSWVGVRLSNTEPVLRVTAESPSTEWARATVQAIAAEIVER